MSLTLQLFFLWLKMVRLLQESPPGQRATSSVRSTSPMVIQFQEHWNLPQEKTPGVFLYTFVYSDLEIFWITSKSTKRWQMERKHTAASEVGEVSDAELEKAPVVLCSLNWRGQGRRLVSDSAHPWSQREIWVLNSGATPLPRYSSQRTLSQSSLLEALLIITYIPFLIN